MTCASYSGSVEELWRSAYLVVGACVQWTKEADEVPSE